MYHHALFPITYTCNLYCDFCAVKGMREKKVDISKCMESIKSKKGEIEWIFITGGEPFLVQGLESICDELRGMGFKVGVTTNGTIFRPEISNHVDRIGISFDGDKEYHDTYRGIGVFDKAVELFRAVKGKCETVIMSTAFKGNLEELVRFEEKVKDLDPDYWQITKDCYDNTLEIPQKLKEYAV
jgi:MoaA/NifB/PqqE/SkfB family radical SAM enzyme